MNKTPSLYHSFIIMLLVAANAFSWPMITTILADIVILILSGGLFVNSKPVLGIREVFVMLAFLTLYTLVIGLTADQVSLYTIGKPIRMLVVYAMFAIMAQKIATYTYKEISIGLLAGLSLHLGAVYLQFFVPVTKLFFYSILDTDDKIAITEHSLRAFGFCASFDAAGLSICVMMVLLWTLYKNTHNIFLFLLSLVALTGCFMVGRTAMLVGSLFFLLMLFSLFKNNKHYFLLSAVVFGVAAYFLLGIGLEIMENNAIEQSYRKESVEYLTGEMLYLPDSFFGILFGTGSSADKSDIGYVKIIHMIGFLGLGLVLYMYFLTVRNLRRVKKRNPSVFRFMLLMLILMLIYNYKLLLLYASGMNDLYILLYFVFSKKLIYYNKE